MIVGSSIKVIQHCWNISVSCLQVELKQTKRVYAMKVIKKELVLDEEVGITTLYPHAMTYSLPLMLPKMMDHSMYTLIFILLMALSV